jgi:hypothetical protein
MDLVFPLIASGSVALRATTCQKPDCDILLTEGISKDLVGLAEVHQNRKEMAQAACPRRECPLSLTTASVRVHFCQSGVAGMGFYEGIRIELSPSRRPYRRRSRWRFPEARSERKRPLSFAIGAGKPRLSKGTRALIGRPISLTKAFIPPTSARAWRVVRAAFPLPQRFSTACASP